MSFKPLAAKLASIVGSKWVLTDPATLTCYARDASVASGHPTAAVLPGSTGEVAAVLRLAAEAGVPVTPRGAGTGLAGGAVPGNGIVLVLTRLRGLEIHKEDLICVAGAGAVTAEIHAAAETAGLFYPPDPSSASVSTLGGNVATNAGGPHGFKYGVTRDYLLGLEVVLADGTVIQTGGRTLKNATGYNLTALLCGSEGTLGVITQAVLRLVPRPEERAGVFALFAEVEAVAQAALSVIAAGISPAALEIMDRTALDCAFGDILGDPVAAALLLEIDGPRETVSRQTAEVEALCRRSGAADIRVAAGNQVEELYRLRRAVSGALVHLYPVKIGEDVAVPVSRVPELIREISGISDKTGVKIAVFGHAADGNLHPNILYNPRETDVEHVNAAIAGIFRAALSHGGTLSGEHGVGVLKKPYFKDAVGTDTVNLMRGIKKLFDPRGLLNPGKIWATDGE
ncbi:MAG: FAD-linked oxidase C-terminal domain-containing protein [Bacillota bacterium]